jgi:phosphate starvation-inducible membrane PsiE
MKKLTANLMDRALLERFLIFFLFFWFVAINLQDEAEFHHPAGVRG